MQTMMAPMRAVANCTRHHSMLFGDQIPTLSPGWMPSASKPSANLSIWVRYSR